MKVRHTNEAYEVGAERAFWLYSPIASDFFRLLTEVSAQTEREEINIKALYSLFSKFGHVIFRKSKQMEEERSHSLSVYYKFFPEEYQRLIGVLKDQEVIGSEPIKWPSYAIEDFAKIRENLMGLENAGDDSSQIIHYIKKIEALLGEVEKKAEFSNRKYEATLAASLRDICRVHGPSGISKEQIECFKGCINALTEGWGELNNEKVVWMFSRLAEVGLTCPPATKKADKDIAEAKELAEDEQLEQTFNELTRKWKDETINLSSMQQIALNFNYQEIIGLGHRVIQLILNELKREPTFWFWALRALTRANPVTEDMYGDVEAMTKTWLEWGHKHGYC